MLGHVFSVRIYFLFELVLQRNNNNNSYIITARIRRMREGNIFRLFVGSPRGRYPNLWSQVLSEEGCPWSVVLGPLRGRGTPDLCTSPQPPRPGLGKGTLCPTPSPPPSQETPRTGCVTGGTLLAVTQEGFLVVQPTSIKTLFSQLLKLIMIECVYRRFTEMILL